MASFPSFLKRRWPACLAFLSAALFNELTLGRILSPDGSIGSPKIRLGILLIQMILAATGWFLLRADAASARRSAAGALFCLATTIPLLEGCIRVLNWAGLPPIRSPHFFAPVNTDTYWVLLAKWKLDQEFLGKANPPAWARIEPHPILGWTVAQTDENPLGVHLDEPMLEAAKDPILFFGASFVVGDTPANESIPFVTGNLMKRTGLNYAMKGYGLDQVYLKAQEILRFPKAPVVVGIVPDNLDVCALSFRLKPKPYFTLEGGELALHTSHIAEGREGFIRNYPLSIGFYSLRLLAGLLPSHPYAITEPTDRIREISEAMIREIARATEGRERLAVVLYEKHRLRYTDWRETLIKQTLEAARMPYLDTKNLILQEAKNTGIPSDDFYFPDGGHPTAQANHLVAKEIAASFKKPQRFLSSKKSS